MVVDTCGATRRWSTMGASVRLRPISGQRGSEWQCGWTTGCKLPTTISRLSITASCIRPITKQRRRRWRNRIYRLSDMVKIDMSKSRWTRCPCALDMQHHLVLFSAQRTMHLTPVRLRNSGVTWWRTICGPSPRLSSALPQRVRVVLIWLGCGGQPGFVAPSARLTAVGQPHDVS